MQESPITTHNYAALCYYCNISLQNTFNQLAQWLRAVVVYAQSGYGQFVPVIWALLRAQAKHGDDALKQQYYDLFIEYQGQIDAAVLHGI